MALKISSIFASKGARALGVAALLVILCNAWVGIRLPNLILFDILDDCMELERRVAAFDKKESVKILVLGNSHALAGLKPPDLVSSLHLPPDAIFSLAISHSTPLEMRLYLERYLHLFPNVKLVLCNVDEVFLNRSGTERLRYLTRFSPSKRLAIAAQRSHWEEKIDLSLGLFFPIADFLGPLHHIFQKSPQFAFNQLVSPHPMSPPFNGIYQELQHFPYRWGFPPPWLCQTPERLSWWRKNNLKDSVIRERALFMNQDEARLPEGFEALSELLEFIEGNGIRTLLVEMPYEPKLLSAMEHLPQGSYQRYRMRLRAYLSTSRRTFVPAPQGLASIDFYDTDHLSPRGAKRMAAHLVSHSNIAQSIDVEP